jgi:hypothetical protein
MSATCRSLRIRLSLVALVIAAAATPLPADELRTWTDKSGKFSVEAEFVEVASGKVRLKLKDGKTVALSLAKLSEDDRMYVRDLLKKRREEATGATEEGQGTAGPTRPTGLPNRERSQWAVGDRVQFREGFAYVPATITAVDGFWVTIHLDTAPKDATQHIPASRVEPLTETVAAAASWSWNPPVMKKPIPADYSGVKRLALNPSASKTLGSDPAPPGVGAEALGAVRFGGKYAHYEKFLTLDVALGAAPMAVAAYSGGKEFQDVNSRLQLVDLKTSVFKGNFSGPAKLKMVHLSPSGKRLATRSEPGETWGPEYLDIWDIGENGLTHVATWLPYGAAREHSQSIDAVRWLDDSRLITLGGEGSLVMWQVDGAKAIYEIGTQSSRIVMSPGGKQFALPTSEGVDIFSVESGVHFAHVPSVVGAASVAFSASGRRLAAVGPLGIEILDVTGTEAPRQFYLGDPGSYQWLDDQFLLGSDGLVVDSTSQTATWRYRRSGIGWLDQGRYWYVVGDDDNRTLVNIVLPHDAAKQAASAVTNVPDLFAVAPGMAVTLDVNLGDATATPEAISLLTTAVQAAGLRVEAGQPIVLSARTRGGDSQEMKYRQMGGGWQEETISVPTRYYDVELLVNGQKVWSASSFQGAPHMPRLEEGDTIQSAVSREMGVSAGFVPRTVPMRIVKAEYQKPRGESQLTERGVEDVGIEAGTTSGMALPGAIPRNFAQ